MLEDTHPLQDELWARIAIDKTLGHDTTWAAFEDVPEDVPTWLEASERGAHYGRIILERDPDLFGDLLPSREREIVYKTVHPSAPLEMLVCLPANNRATNSEWFELIYTDLTTGEADVVYEGYLDEVYMAFQAFEKDFDLATDFFIWLNGAKAREEARIAEEERLRAEAAAREAARIQEEKDRAEIERELETMADTFGAF